MIRTQGLTKRFGPTVALSNIDLDVARGQCLGLAGANGGGRTTLLRILATLLEPSSGIVVIDGIDAVRRVYDARSRLAYVGGEFLNGHGLRVREYLRFVQAARCTGDKAATIGRVDEAVDRSGVPPDAGVDALSSGLRQRLALAAALVTGSQVLLLDDPLRAIDADGRSRFLEWICEARDRGATIVVALNDDGEMKALCHDVVHLDSGRLGSRVRLPGSGIRGIGSRVYASGEA